MPRCEFGTPQKTSDEANLVLAKLAPRLRQTLVGIGLHDISAINPTDAFVVALVNEYNVGSVEEFLYLEPDWPEQAAASAANHPSFASMQAFVTSMSMTWVNNGANLTADMKQVCARVMRAYKEVYKVRDDVNGAKPVGEDMDAATENNLSTQFESMYGQPPVVGDLASSAICNSLNRQLATGLVVDDMKSMTPRSDPKRGDPYLAFHMGSATAKAMNVSTKGIGSVEDFLTRVRTYAKSLVYVSGGHVAPADAWAGKACYGVVHGVRYQFSRDGGEHWVNYWVKHAPKFRAHISELIKLESSMRSEWVNSYGTEKMSLESAMRESIVQKGGAVLSWSPKRDMGGDDVRGGGLPPPFGGRRGGRDGGGKGGAQQLGGAHQPSGAQGGGRGGFVTQDGRDISTLPGFRVGLRPFKGVHENKQFCTHYNRGLQCQYGDNCSKWHKCNAILPGGGVCNSTEHKFVDHPIG